MAIPLPQKIVVQKEYNEQFLAPINIVCEPGGEWTVQMISHEYDGVKELKHDSKVEIIIKDLKGVAAIDANAAQVLNAVMTYLGTVAYKVRATKGDQAYKEQNIVTPEMIQAWNQGG